MKRKLIIPIILLLIAFIAVTVLMLTNDIKLFDDGIYNYLISKRSNNLDFFFINTTKLCNTLTIVIITMVLLVTLNNINRIILTVNLIFTMGFNKIIKHIIKRPRPSHLRLIKQGGYSFPSGHAMASIAIYGFLIYVTNKKVKNKYIKIILNIFFTLIIITVGLSRIYVGVHYPSDILAGYCLAISILLSVILLIERFRGNINDKNGCK